MIGIDFLIYLKYKKEYIREYNYIDIYPPVGYIDNYKDGYSPESYVFQISDKNRLDYFRNDYNKYYDKKKSIIIFGCSFVYGEGLEYNQTISYKLSKLTQRNVFNFGISAGGIQHMLALLNNPNFYKKIKQEPEYVIYVYIPSHILRLNTNIYPNPMMTNGINLQYKIKNNDLEMKRYPLDNFSNTFIVKSLYYQFDIYNMNKNNPEKAYKNFELLNKIFIKSRELLKERYPNIKFVILNYEVEDDESQEYEYPQMWEKLKEEGFIVINTSELMNREFKYESEDTTADGYHPSEMVWDKLCPKIAKKLKL